MRLTAVATWLWLGIAAIRACSCVVVAGAADPSKSVAIVFRGTASESETLPQHPEMHGRTRYVVTFRVDQYWSGKLGRVVRLYLLSPRADCMGADYRPGEEYLIYASENPAQDYKFDDLFWYGWTDVTKKGTPIIEPITACMPGGKTTDAAVKNTLRKLGKGHLP